MSIVQGLWIRQRRKGHGIGKQTYVQLNRYKIVAIWYVMIPDSDCHRWNIGTEASLAYRNDLASALHTYPSASILLDLCYVVLNNLVVWTSGSHPTPALTSAPKALNHRKSPFRTSQDVT